MGTTKTKDQLARLMKSLAGLQIGPENSTPLGPNGAKKSVRLNLSFKGRGVQDFEEHLKTSSWPMHLRKATLLLSLVTPSRPRLLQSATTPSARLGG